MASLETEHVGDLKFEYDSSGDQVLIKHKEVTIATFKHTAVTFPGTFNFDGAIDMDSTLDVAGAVTFQSTLALTGELTSPTIQRAQVTVTNAEIKALAASQKSLVAAESGKVHIFEGAMMRLNAGSEVLTESTDNMVINYVDDSGVAASGAIEATGFIDQAADTYNWVPPTGIAAGTAAQLVNTALVLDNTGDGEYGGNASNDATMTIWVYYRTITV